MPNAAKEKPGQGCPIEAQYTPPAMRHIEIEMLPNILRVSLKSVQALSRFRIFCSSSGILRMRSVAPGCISSYWRANSGGGRIPEYTISVTRSSFSESPLVWAVGCSLSVSCRDKSPPVGVWPVSGSLIHFPHSGSKIFS